MREMDTMLEKSEPWAKSSSSISSGPFSVSLPPCKCPYLSTNLERKSSHCFSEPKNGNTVGLLDSPNCFHRFLRKKRRTKQQFAR